MAKHVLFYDELERSSPAADGTSKIGSEIHEAGRDAGGDLYKNINDKKKTTLRWLRLLFLATLALFVFQLLLGWMARAVTLIADSAHSGSDVVSYGLNLCIERLKYSMRGKSRITPKSFANVTRVIDTAGSLASLVTLLFATWFATTEAIERLRMPSDEDSGSIGFALMFFAIVSTFVNVALLVFYRCWHRKRSKEAQGNFRHSKQDAGEKNDKDPQESGGQGRTEFDPTKFAWCQPCKTPPAATLEDDVQDETLESPDRCADETFGNNLSTLHILIHPGCTCASGREMIQVEEEDEQIDEGAMKQTNGEHEGAAAMKQTNLNVIAAMLHLIADLLRGILILGVSILIQSGAVQDAEYADAICALVVGVLICIGSLALFLRVSARVCATLRPTNPKDDCASQTSTLGKP